MKDIYVRSIKDIIRFLENNHVDIINFQGTQQLLMPMLTIPEYFVKNINHRVIDSIFTN